MSLALLFSGQGTQHPHMLRWVTDGALLRATGAALGVDDWRRAAADAAWLARNDNAQVLLTGVALAAWRQLEPALPSPAAIAGYSVGELAAFGAAGVLDAHDAIELALERARAMDRCAVGAPGGLLAVSGLPLARVEACLAALAPESALHVAIRNGPVTAVVGGTDTALQSANLQLTMLGARCVRLNIGVASHTPSMRAASLEFASLLSRRVLHAPRLPLFSCTADRIDDAAAAAAALAAQISSTLLWSDCLESIHARRVDCVLEIGPGAALASMWNQRYPDTPARSADEFETEAAVIAWVRRHA